MSLEFMKAKIARNDLRTVKKLKSTNLMSAITNKTSLCNWVQL